MFLKFWIQSPNSEHLSRVLFLEYAVIAIKLFLALLSKGQWQIWMLKPFYWGWVKHFGFGKPIPKLDLEHQWSKQLWYLLPSLGMAFLIQGKNSGWLHLRLQSPFWGHWWERVWGQSLSCGGLHAQTQKSHVLYDGLIFRITGIRPQHWVGSTQWFLTIKLKLQSRLANAREIRQSAFPTLLPD